MKKYELTDEIQVIKHPQTGEEVTLHRIRALKGFTVQGFEVKAGDLGGWIEGEKNLPHVYNAWVYDNAEVYGAAEVSGDARVSGEEKGD